MNPNAAMFESSMVYEGGDEEKGYGHHQYSGKLLFNIHTYFFYPTRKMMLYCMHVDNILLFYVS